MERQWSQRVWSSVVGGAVLTLGSAGWAQEVQVEVAPPRVVSIEAVGDEKGLVISRVVGDGPIMAVPGMFGGNFSYVPEDDLGIADNEQFQQELGLVPEQREKLQGVRREMQEMRQKLFSQFRPPVPLPGQAPAEGGKANVQFDGKKFAEQMREGERKITEETKKKLSEILLPHQVERLKQIRFQIAMRNQGSKAIAGGELGDILGLTDKQKEELAEKQRKAEKELREKIEQLRRDTYKEVVDEVLTSEQREKLSKLVGPEIQVKPAEPRLLGRPANPAPKP